MRTIYAALAVMAGVIGGCMSGGASTLHPPTLAKPRGAGEVAALRLQNVGPATQAARYVTFGQAFRSGDVPVTAGLVAKFASGTIPVQVDVKSRYPDRSVRFAVLTLLAPQLAGNATADAMLATGGSQGSPINLQIALASHSLRVSFSGGVSASVDAILQLTSALAAGHASYWLQGPNATQARVDVPITGSLHVLFDVTAYADGAIATEATFANDYAMQSVGGRLQYTVTIARDGQTVYSSPSLNHYQYQQWRYTDTNNPINVQRDVGYILSADALQNYDVSTGIESNAIPAVPYAPLGAAGIRQYMPSTGDRPDIGPVTLLNTQWLLSQDARAANSALAQANGAASVPWHFFDKSTGDYLSLDKYPSLWTDPRGSPTLTQPVTEPTWTTDTAHQPGLSFVPYLLTGARFHLDQIDAQAAFAVLATWNAPRQNGRGIVVNGAEQIRAQAWNLRQISDAAWANPDGTPAKEYWTRILQNNMSSLLASTIPAMNAAAGAVHGFIPGDYRGDATSRLQTAPWQQDFFVSSMATVAARGSADAKTALQWMANWQVGRCGHGLAAAVAYDYYVGPTSTAYYQQWSDLVAANGASDTLPSDGGYWVPLGLETLATVYNATGSTEARAFYDLVKSKNAKGTDAASYSADYAKFNIVPKDGAVATPPTAPPLPSAKSETIFGNITAPGASDRSPWVLGTIFTALRPGKITAVRIYAVQGETGNHTFTLWNNKTGQQIGGALTFSAVGPGWVTYTPPSPISIGAGVPYTVAVTTGVDSQKYYAYAENALVFPGNNGRSLSYPANAGVFGANLNARPTQIWHATNYMRDIVFVAD
jgi:hypothetical protein